MCCKPLLREGFLDLSALAVPHVYLLAFPSSVSDITLPSPECNTSGSSGGTFQGPGYFCLHLPSSPLGTSVPAEGPVTAEECPLGETRWDQRQAFLTLGAGAAKAESHGNAGCGLSALQQDKA